MTVVVSRRRRRRGGCRHRVRGGRCRRRSGESRPVECAAPHRAQGRAGRHDHSAHERLPTTTPGRRLHRRSLAPRRRPERPAHRRACRLRGGLRVGGLSPLYRRAANRVERHTARLVRAAPHARRCPASAVRVPPSGLFDPGQPATEVQSASQVTLCVCGDDDRLLARSGASRQAAAARLHTYLISPRLVTPPERVGRPADQALRSIEDRGLPRRMSTPDQSDPVPIRSVHPLAGVPGTSRGAAQRPRAPPAPPARPLLRDDTRRSPSRRRRVPQPVWRRPARILGNRDQKHRSSTRSSRRERGERGLHLLPSAAAGRCTGAIGLTIARLTCPDTLRSSRGPREPVNKGLAQYI